MAHYDLKKPFCLQTDASKKGISAILFQLDDDGYERIIAIMSRCLTPHEKNYTVTEIELLAIVSGLIKFQKYLLGSHFEIYTDHLALTFLLKTHFFNLRLVRWLLLISNFSFEMHHCKGVENIAADYYIKNKIVFHYTKNYIKARALIPKNIRNKLIDLIHAQIGHAGIQKTIKFISENLYWKNQKRDIKKRIKTCDLCQRTKHLNLTMEGRFQSIIPKNPNEMIAVDFYGPLPASRAGAKYLFVVKDLFSKLTTLYSIKAANTKTCLNKLINDYFVKRGKPTRILSDHGTQFTSHKWKETLNNLGVEICFSSIRHPQSNPVERTMRELGRFFRAYCSSRHTSWSNYVSKIEDWLNITINDTTGMSPYTVHFGKNPKDKIAEISKIDNVYLIPRKIQLENLRDRPKKKAETRAINQKKISKIHLKRGDLVLIKIPHISKAENKETHKFWHIFFGPYMIKREININAFELVSIENENEVKGIYNRKDLRKYYLRQE